MSLVCLFMSLIGNYVFDREGRYGERFYCGPHYATVRMYGWKKFELLSQEECDGDNKYPAEVHNLLVPPVSQQVSHLNGALGSYLCESGRLLHFETQPREDFRVETIFLVVFTVSFFIISLLFNPSEVHDFVLDELIIGL